MNAINQLVLNTMAVATLSEIMIICLIVFTIVSIYMRLMVEDMGWDRWRAEEQHLKLMEMREQYINQYVV